MFDEMSTYILTIGTLNRIEFLKMGFVFAVQTSLTSVNVCQVFDGSHERSGCVDGGVGLIETYGGNVLDCFFGSTNYEARRLYCVSVMR